MRSTYRVIAYAFAGMGVWIDKVGGVLDKASMEGDLDFPASSVSRCTV